VTFLNFSYKFFFIFFAFMSVLKSEIIVLDELKNPGKTIQGQEWSFFTDGVMGGLSEGSAKLDKIENVPCYRMIGNVTTENNGGFIQIRALLKPKININDYEGVFAYIYGNDKNYNIHIRTGRTVAPWQYYSYRFFSPNKWHKIKAPFSKFKKSNFYQPKNLSNQKIKSIGLVAAFENFKADICLAKIGLY
tara:strand:+ start:524 stop:1096 length:573 start_codon:yes stop_codon:yes gene_type:complete